MEITRTSGPLGATVDGFDLTSPSRPELNRLADALYEHRVLTLRDPGGTTPEQFARFGHEWGDPIMPATVSRHRHPQFQEIIRMTNSPATPPESRDGAMHWHSDSIYEATPASVTILYGVEVPRVGNETLFADCVAAYDALSGDMKRCIDSLRVQHDPDGAGKVDFEGEVHGAGSTKPGPVVTHPLALRHPVTGRISLFAFSSTAVGIVGWEEKEAIDLLIELKRHVLRDEFRYAARAEEGAILMWDNYSVIHSATRTVYSDAPGERRVIHRISTKGIPSACAA
ncbi:TauD/TfdA dioxygenase family protein [Streptomyces sp. NPDC001852]|uniref:TauD/TfdA dioxygenase family protein n=1 Tax=unclassified Streptomyces TaxID=2593676 RepID=UPI00332A81A7